MTPYISVIIPCYNVATYLPDCFDCLLGQTIGFENLQLIFVDDCSTDQTLSVLTEFEAAHSDQVIVISNEYNIRQGGAREVGMTYASAPYIAFLDADDRIDATMYQKLYEKVVEYDCDFSMCRHDRRKRNEAASVYEPTAQSRLITISNDLERKEAILNQPFHCYIWDKVYKKSYLEEANLHFPWHMAYEDNPFCCQIHLTAKRAYVLEECLYHYMINDSSTILSRNKPYHLDILKANDVKWEAIRSYDKYELFRHELNFEYMTTGYYGCMHTLLLRYDEVPYEAYLSLRENILNRVPDYNANPYLKNNVSEVYSLLLMLLPAPVSKEILATVQQNFWKILKFDPSK